MREHRIRRSIRRPQQAAVTRLGLMSMAARSCWRLALLMSAVDVRCPALFGHV